MSRIKFSEKYGITWALCTFLTVLSANLGSRPDGPNQDKTLLVARMDAGCMFFWQRFPHLVHRWHLCPWIDQSAVRTQGCTCVARCCAAFDCRQDSVRTCATLRSLFPQKKSQASLLSKVQHTQRKILWQNKTRFEPPNTTKKETLWRHGHGSLNLFVVNWVRVGVFSHILGATVVTIENADSAFSAQTRFRYFRQIIWTIWERGRVESCFVSNDALFMKKTFCRFPRIVRAWFRGKVAWTKSVSMYVCASIPLRILLRHKASTKATFSASTQKRTSDIGFFDPCLPCTW